MSEKSPLIEFDADDEELRTRKKIPLADLIEGYRKRYAFDSKVGSVILRKLPFLELERIIMRLSANDSRYADLVSKHQDFMGLVGAGVELNKQQADAFAKNFAELRSYEPHFYLACIVEPKIENLDEFNALLSGMDAQEKKDFLLALQKVACQTVDEGAVSHTGLRVADRFKIPLADGMTMETLPTDLGIKLVQQINEEDEAIKRKK